MDNQEREVKDQVEEEVEETVAEANGIEIEPLFE